jgi:hypothetical protein
VVPALAALVAFSLFLVNVVLFFGWFRARRSLDGLKTEQATLQESNKGLRGVNELLRNKKAQFCNRTDGDVTIHWMAAAYEDGGRLRYFDSQRCEDWQPAFIKAGQARMLNLSSMQQGCNWNGSVIFHAMFFSRVSEDAARSYRTADAWSGYDKECYTLE